MSALRQSTVVPFQSAGTGGQKTPGDARIAPRRRILKAGVVAYNDRHTTLACMVRDISTTGARIRVDGSVSAPDTFELLIALDGLEASCEVVWRNGNELGARFLSAPRVVAPKRTQVINALAPAKAPTLRRQPRPGETV